MRCRLSLLGLLLATAAAPAVPSLFEKVADGVWVVRDDQGQWGTMADGLGITHQSSAGYLAKKVLDLSDVPADVWDATKEVRLSMYFLVRDYSWHDRATANGLDEAFQIAVNGQVHEYPTKGNGPVYNERGLQPIEWYDFPLPKTEFRRGPNEIVIGKAQNPKNDDYLYLGIDNSVKRGNSSVSFGDGKWTQERLTVPGGNGEYMVRLYLLARDSTTAATWQPGGQPETVDADHLIDYAGSHGAPRTADGLALRAGQQARVEWSAQAFDRLAPLSATVEATGEVRFAWLNAADAPVQASPQRGRFTCELPAKRNEPPTGLLLTATAPVTIKQVTVRGAIDYHPKPAVIDQAPVIRPVAEAAAAAPSCYLRDVITLTNGRLTAVFKRGERLRLTSLRHEALGAEAVRDAAALWLFAVEVDGRRYAGSRDFTLASLRGTDRGFSAELRLPSPALRADLTVGIEDEGLRLGLKLTNSGGAPVAFKLAFPHLAGLTVSDDPAGDYYYFPWGGGIITDTPAFVRRGYGDHEALYQVMDLFSPTKGGGWMVRADDDAGWHKVLALRKHVPGRGSASHDATHARVKPEVRWNKSLEVVPGTSFAYEYDRRTRPAGGSFAPADAVLAAHVGDWHQALAAYAAWAHRVWRFRPYPGRLKTVHNMIATGWAGDFLFKNGQYRTDFIKPNTDCIELMSWWDWSPLGPFGTPFDQLEKVLSPAAIKGWKPYFVKDPVTGQTMWNNQPGDYDGYNERFGGLPAFRTAIDTYRKMGALVTLYTDPFRMDFTSKIGLKHGAAWCAVGPDGKPCHGYDVYNPCHDLPEVRQWVAQAMERVMRETGADGLRLDEYGHSGYPCHNPDHRHTFAEPGLTQWNKAVGDAIRQVREGIDRVRPDLVLTTEHPSYDYHWQWLDGVITYDYSVQKCDLRPLEVNTQRFYFPECKAYELDHMGQDPKDQKKFWNGAESFGRYWPQPYDSIYRENEDVYQSRDAEPLVPTTARRVYANRFGGAGKVIYHLYNATGHTFDGDCLRVRVPAGHHLVDLLTGEAGALTEAGEARNLRLYLPRNRVACVAVLPQVLTVARDRTAVTVGQDAPKGALKLAVCGAKGERLLEAAAVPGANKLDLSSLASGQTAVCVKLLAGGQLVDLVPLAK